MNDLHLVWQQPSALNNYFFQYYTVGNFAPPLPFPSIFNSCLAPLIPHHILLLVCKIYINGPFSQWPRLLQRIYTRILQFVVFSCKLGMLLSKPHWDKNFNKKGKKTSGILIVVVRWRHYENHLFMLCYFL